MIRFNLKDDTQLSYLLSTKIPDRTDSYTPIPVQLIIDTIEALQFKYNYDLIKSSFSSKRDGNQQKLRFVFDSELDFMGFEVVILNSYDKTIALKAGAGATAYACWNLQVCSETLFTNKHVGDIDTKVYDFLSDVFTQRDTQIKEVKTLMTELNNIQDFDLRKIIGTVIYDNPIMTGESINLFLTHLRDNPPYDFVEKGSLNEVYQAATYALRETHPMNFFKVHKKVFDIFRDYLEDYFKIT